MSKVVLSILVNNTSGVLSRVAGLFSRRGYNIDSLTVGETENPAFSRMTVSVTGDDIILEQIEKQVNKLEDVKSVRQLTGEAQSDAAYILSPEGSLRRNTELMDLRGSHLYHAHHIGINFILGYIGRNVGQNHLGQIQ